MPRLNRPLKELRTAYSSQLNQGRELLARHVERGHDFTVLLDDAQAWDRANVLLVQTTYAGADEPEYHSLPPLSATGDLDSDLRSVRREVSAGLNELGRIENELSARKSGCVGLGG